jgi:hypothetical protein
MISYTFVSGSEQAAVDESFQVMAQGRARQIDVVLDFSGGAAVAAGLNDETQDSQAHGMSERTEPSRVFFKDRSH